MADMFGGAFDGFTSLFDGASDYLPSGSTILKGVGAAGKALASNQSQKSGASALSEANNLNSGYQTPGTNVDATKSKAVESVNPDLIEQMWRNRLSQFASIQAKTGVKFK